MAEEKSKPEVPLHWCIFEKRICKFAENKNGCFECKAPSDEEMSCR